MKAKRITRSDAGNELLLSMSQTQAALLQADLKELFEIMSPKHLQSLRILQQELAWVMPKRSTNGEHAFELRIVRRASSLP
jgi:hypothetical protein